MKAIHRRISHFRRTTVDNRIIFGGEDVLFRDASRRDALVPGKGAALLRKARRLFPRIEMEVAYRWAGTFGETRDGLPYIGTARQFRHGYFALGYGGNGVTFSWIAANLLLDQFLERRNPDADLFALDRSAGMTNDRGGH